MINTLINLIIDNSILFFVFLNFLLILFLLNYSINLISIIERISLFLQFVILPVLNRIIQALILLMLLSLMINGTLNTVYLFNYLSDDSFTSTYFDLAEIIKNFNFFGGEKKEVANEDLLVSYPDSTVKTSEIIVQKKLSIPIGKYNKDNGLISVEEVPIFFEGDEKAYYKILLLLEKEIKNFWEDQSNINNLTNDMAEKLHNYNLMYKNNYNKSSPQFYIPKIANFGWAIKSGSLTIDGCTIHYDLIKKEDIENLCIFLKTTNISDSFEIFMRQNLLPPSTTMQTGFYANNHPYIGILVSATNNGNASIPINSGFQCTHGVPIGLKDKFVLISKYDFLGKERAQYIEKDIRVFSSEVTAPLSINNNNEIYQEAVRLNDFKKQISGWFKPDDDISLNNQTAQIIDFFKAKKRAVLNESLKNHVLSYHKGYFPIAKCVTQAGEGNFAWFVSQKKNGFHIADLLKANNKTNIFKYIRPK